MEFDFRVAAYECDEHFIQFLSPDGTDHKLVGRKIVVLHPVTDSDSHIEHYVLVKLPNGTDPLYGVNYSVRFTLKD